MMGTSELNSGSQPGPQPGSRPGSQHRVLVTGSRGKSSIVRLLYVAMHAAGLQTYARITGVVPREIGPHGNRVISRSGSPHIEEMRWWLGQLPVSAQGIVLENSAITADLHDLAGRWLQPDVTVLTNTLPDHQELWGPTTACAAGVLTQGIPEHGTVILPASLQTDDHLRELLRQRHCQLVFAEPAYAVARDYQATNLGLALKVIEQLGLVMYPALNAMLELPRDRYDFHVAQCAGAEVAMAFSANDIASTRALFKSLKWSQGETRLLYNHRADRPGRFRSFVEWLNQSGWREVLIIGDRPGKRIESAHYFNIKNKQGLTKLFKPGDRIFGCGNISGLPLSLARALDR